MSGCLHKRATTLLGASNRQRSDTRDNFSSESPGVCTGKLVLTPEQGGKEILESGTRNGGHPSISLGVLPDSAPVLLVVVSSVRF